MLQVGDSGGQSRTHDSDAAIPGNLTDHERHIYARGYANGYKDGTADTLASQQAPQSSPQPQRLHLSNLPTTRLPGVQLPLLPQQSGLLPTLHTNGQPGIQHLVGGLQSFSLSGASRNKRHHADSQYTSAADAAPSSVGAVSAASCMVRSSPAAGGAHNEVKQVRSEKSKGK